MEQGISTLLGICRRLVDLRDTLSAQLQREALPFWLPDHVSQNRDFAIQSALALYTDECPTPPRSGLLCVSPASAETVVELNQCKQELKASIQSLKEALPPGRDNRTFHALLTQTDSPLFQRDPIVAKALRQIRFGDINLIWAYRHLRLLSPEVLSVRWCWHIKRREVIRLSYAEVVELANRRLKGKARDIALEQLAYESSGAHFARARSQPSPQLKANIVALDNNEKVRYSIPTPSIVLIQQDVLPEIRWVASEEPETKRKGRNDATIEKEAFIPALKIFRYKEK